MAQKKTAPKDSQAFELSPPSASRQVGFFQLLAAARKQWLIDALSEALANLDQSEIKVEITKYVPQDVQKILAAAGIRDEYVFPLPSVIEAKPSLVGYYRLLLSPQKGFYQGSTGMSRFKSMETTGAASISQIEALPAFCKAMAQPLAELVRQIPDISERDIRELPLLTFGSQLQGSNNTTIGKKAMEDLFMVVAEIVDKHVTLSEGKKITVKNSAKRTVRITLTHDPDVRVEEVVRGGVHKILAIEVKGGTDVSNAHNRAGEAEKSHLKAKQAGFAEFWTVISKKGVSVTKLKSESQTTNHWFDIAEVLARKGTDYEAFKDRLARVVGIPVS